VIWSLNSTTPDLCLYERCYIDAVALQTMPTNKNTLYGTVQIKSTVNPQQHNYALASSRPPNQNAEMIAASGRAIRASHAAHHPLKQPNSYPWLQHAHRRTATTQKRRPHADTSRPHVPRAAVGPALAMADAPSGLLTTCALLFAGAYGCGLLPRLVTVSPARLGTVRPPAGWRIFAWAARCCCAAVRLGPRAVGFLTHDHTTTRPPAHNPPHHPRDHPQINAVSAGLLIGSGLCVILPEGFEALHESNVSLAVACKSSISSQHTAG